MAKNSNKFSWNIFLAVLVTAATVLIINDHGAWVIWAIVIFCVFFG